MNRLPVSAQLFTPRLVAFYRARHCDQDLSEDLTQLVMLTVYRKAGQVRDRALFRAWLFRIAHNALCRHYGRQAREVETVHVENPADHWASASAEPEAAFEFMQWMGFLKPREREVMTLRFVEQWEYHEIAAAKDMPIGTVQWIVFNAKRKLAPRLAACDQGIQQERDQSTRNEGLDRSRRHGGPENALRSLTAINKITRRIHTVSKSLSSQANRNQSAGFFLSK